MGDLDVRLAAFEWLREQVRMHGDSLPRRLLEQGFRWHDERVPLLGPQGIFKPRVCEQPLSITTSPNSPYSDTISQESLLQYRYRGTDPAHRDNAGLRRSMALRLPLVYFFGLDQGIYLAVWPVFIVGDDPLHLTFTVAVDEERRFPLGQRDLNSLQVADEPGDYRRAYLTAQTKVRLHQRSFRERVLRAYREQCAFCRLKHQELLDAAHILPDSDPEGEPRVNNGMALCKLHHAAFDSHFLGVTPDYIVRVRPAILREPDGPMHQYGLKAMEGLRIILPPKKNQWPDPLLLQARFQHFLEGC